MRTHLALAALAFPVALGAQLPSQATRDSIARLAAEDHRALLAQLGIAALRPGPSGNESAPNAANYDESRASPFTALPDPLRFDDGRWGRAIHLKAGFPVDRKSVV